MREIPSEKRRCATSYLMSLSELAKPLKGCQNNDTKLEKMRDTISTTSVSLNSQNLSKGANMLSVNPEAETRIAN